MKTLLVKRLFDLVVVLMTLPIWGGVVLAVAIAVRLRLGSPVFFRQPRVGQDERVFEIVKFRSMTDDIDATGKLLPDEARITRFGKWLRQSSLDELPELWNVLSGHMSLVGPRPLLVHYLPRYSSRQKRRHLVPPGLTGWAQVNGRNALSWEEKFELDVWYADNRSLRLDCTILLRTLGIVFTQRGVSAPGHVTMPEFIGSPSSGNSGRTPRTNA